MPSRLNHQLSRLDEIARSLAETKSVEEVKSVRDKAEAVRRYAKSAALGLKIQNHAADLKLQAERRAGTLLSQMIKHGGDRRSSSHDESLKLADLGIDHNQSARWREEADIPEHIYSLYVATADKLGQDITAQGLLRLARMLRGGRAKRQEAACRPESRVERPRRCDDLHSNGINGFALTSDGRSSDTLESASQLIAELTDHRNLLADLLTPYCSGDQDEISAGERRLVARLLAEMKDLLSRLERDCCARVQHGE